MRSKTCILLILSAITLLLSSSALSGLSAVGLKLEADRLRELTIIHPDSAELHVELASVYLRQGTARARALALKHMEMASKQEPDNADYHLMLGELYLDGTFWNYGVKQLERTAELEPEKPYAHFRLGRAHLDRAFEEWQMRQFQEARSGFIRALSFDPDYAEAATCLALCYLDIGETDSSLSVLRRLPADSLDTEALLVLGMAYNEKGALDSSQTAFSMALSGMAQSRRRRYLSLDAIATPTELEILSRTRPAWLDSVTLLLWRMKDPDPATRVNERLVEHLARVSFSDFHFSVPRLDKPGSLTTRGEVYVRYGRPINWYYDPFGTNTFCDEVVNPAEMLARTPLDYDFDTYMEMGSRYRSPRIGADKRRWLWAYDGFTLNFEDTFLNGDYSFPYERDWSAYRYEYLEKHLPEVFEADIRRRMRVVITGLCFMDPDGSTRVKAAYGCDFNGLDYGEEGGWPAGEFMVEGAFLDSLYNEALHVSFSREIRADSTAIHLTPYPLIDTLSVKPPPGNGVIAVSLKSKQNEAIGYAHCDVVVREFGESLEMSDLELRFADQGRPNPSHVYEIRSKAYIAFEAYNIATGEDGAGKIKVSYEFRRREKPSSRTARIMRFLAGTVGMKPETEIASLSSSHVLTTDGASAAQVMGIDLSSLLAGHYEVEVGIEDLLTGAVTSRTVELTIASNLTL
jgi:GWxTD domain-containing protein